jgi:hypothetical protein
MSHQPSSRGAHVRLLVAVLPSLVLVGAGCSFSPPPMVPVGAPAPISFQASSEGERSSITVSGDGRTPQTCELPCTMNVPSGSALVAVSGPRKWVAPVVFPKAPAHAEVKRLRRGQAVAGWVLALAGLATGGVALPVTANGSPKTQLTGGVVGVTAGVVGLVGVIIALTAGKDELRFTDPVAGAGPRAPLPPEPPNPARCRSHLDCKAGLVCPSGECVAPACVADKDCPAGQGCSLEGQCERAPR